MDEQQYGWPELGITDLTDLIWDGRLVVALVTLLTIVVGAVLYFVLPQRYESIVQISPLTGAKFSSFAGLKEVRSFDYTRDTLLVEYAKYLTDRDLLLSVERDTNARDLDVKFDLTLPKKDSDQSSDRDEDFNIRMTASYDDKKALDDFVTQALKRASRNLAEGLRLEVERKVAAFDEKRAAEIRRLEVEIAGKRQKLKAERADSIEKLSAEALVARSFGLDKPLELQAQALTVDRVGSSLLPQVQPPAILEVPQQPLLREQQRQQLLLEQIFPPEATIPLPRISNTPRAAPSAYPEYFDGYLAIEEKVKLLKSRQDDDAFIPDLRDLEEQIYVLSNDPLSLHIRQMLALSMLNEPETAVVASYSLAGAESKKSFPKAPIFAAVTLAVGLILGASLAILLGVRRLKRDLQSSTLGRSPAVPAS